MILLNFSHWKPRRPSLFQMEPYLFRALPAPKQNYTVVSSHEIDPAVPPVTGTMTKVVCTLGPASDSESCVNQLVANGMHIARINFSHVGNDYTRPKALFHLVRNAPGHHKELAIAAATVTNIRPVNMRAILVDIKGPKIRTKSLQANAEVINIASGAEVEITIHDVSKDAKPASDNGPHRIQVDYASIAKSVNVSSIISFDDGLITLQVLSKDPAVEFVRCVVLNGGPIRKNKGVNLPNSKVDLPALTEKDKADLKWACEAGADFVAASFIRSSSHARSVIAFIDRCVADLRLKQPNNSYIRPLVISKIENKEGVENFEEILKESDGIMVARGDLGVEIPYRKVFAAQKMMVSACNAVGKPVIVATQMLDSMQRNPRPTRAEVTDVGTAVLDGADAVMLSGETASGMYPIESLNAMISIATEADTIADASRSFLENSEQRRLMTPLEEEMDAIAESAVRSARDMKAKAILLVTSEGKIARAVAKHKPTIPVLAFCTDERVARQLQLHRAIKPILIRSVYDSENNAVNRMGFLRAEAVRTAKELAFVKPGDRIVTVDRTAGRPHDNFQYSHNLKISTVL